MKKYHKKKTLILVLAFLFLTVTGVWVYHEYDLGYLISKSFHKGGHAPNPKYDKVYGHGIDLSHHNPEPDWDKLEIDFVILKATEGTSIQDHKFQKWRKECEKRKIPVGAYHFFVGLNSPEKEFDNFRNVVKENIDIIPVLDIERKPKNISTKQFQEKFYRFSKRCLDVYGCLPIIYCSEGFYVKYLKKTLKKRFGSKPILLWFGNVGMKYKRYNHTPEIHQAKISKVKGSKVRIDVNELHTPLKNILYKK